MPSRLRSRGNQQVEDNEDRKKMQQELVQKKLDELKIRFENAEIQTTQKKEKTKDMSKIEAYKSEKQIPKDIRPG